MNRSHVYQVGSAHSFCKSAVSAVNPGMLMAFIQASFRLVMVQWSNAFTPPPDARTDNACPGLPLRTPLYRCGWRLRFSRWWPLIIGPSETGNYIRANRPLPKLPNPNV